MKTKHTPGPWHLIDTASLTRNEARSSLLANKSPVIHGILHGVDDADAALICAAPEMLEALEFLLDTWTMDDHSRQLVNDVIRKARGEV